MSQYQFPSFAPGTFVQTVNGKTRARKTTWIIVGAVAILVLSIIGGVIGTRSSKDKDCNCRRPTDAGWMGFSITYFILSVVGAIILAVMFFRKSRAMAP